MSAPGAHSALLVAARQLADDARAARRDGTGTSRSNRECRSGTDLHSWHRRPRRAHRGLDATEEEP